MPSPSLLRALSSTTSLIIALVCVAGPARGDDAKGDDEGAEDTAASHDDDANSDTAASDKSDKSKKKASDEGEESDEGNDDFGHMGQIGVRVGLVGGYRMVLRYDASPYCATPDPLKGPGDQLKFCGHGAPLAVDLGLSFALLDFFEPYFWVKLGLSAEEATDTEPIKVFGIGARLYTMSDAAFKIFIEPAVAYETEGGRGTPEWQTNNPQYSRDIVFHLAAGPQIDFHQNFGAYLTGGVTTGVIRALHTSLDLALGVQGRFP
jgi:hypothetical protein